MDIFENSVFDRLSKQIKQLRHKAFSGDVSFEHEVTKSLLDFSSLKRHDAKVKVTRTEEGYDIRFSKSHMAFNFMDLMKEENPDTNMMFTDDLLNFEPDEDLIYKSKIPLWVVCPLEAGKRVVIKRAW